MSTTEKLYELQGRIMESLSIIPRDQYPDTILLTEEEVALTEGQSLVLPNGDVIRITTRYVYDLEKRLEARYQSRIEELENKLQEYENRTHDVLDWQFPG